MAKSSKKKKQRSRKGGADDDDAPKSTKAKPQQPRRPAPKTVAQSAFERKRAEALDDDDEFADGADKVSLYKKQTAESDSEDYDQEVSAPSDSDEDEEDEGDGPGDDDDDFQEKKAKLLKEEANTSKAWGRKKKDFYTTETNEYELMGKEEEGAIEQEEAESRRLQKELLADLNEQDVDMTSLEALLAAKPKDKAGSKTEAGFGDAELLTAWKKDLTELQTTGQAEKLSKDAKDMTRSEKLEVLKTENPEFLTLLDELKGPLSELRNSLHPIILKAREMPKAEGLSFLELKYRLLLSYCTNMSFYLLLKAEGKPVKKHPVVLTLSKLRLVMEKIRSIDSKLKYQVDKLLKIASLGPGHAPSKQDPLSFKPNASEMMPKADQTEGGVYQAPKLTAVQFDADERETAKMKAKKERARLRAERSSMVSDLKDELNPERPQEIKAMGAFEKPKFLREREEFEESQFVRLTETRADKKRRKESERIRAHADLDFDDFGDLQPMTENAEKKYGSKYDKIAEKKVAKAEAKVPWQMNEDLLAAGEAQYDSVKAKSKKKKEAQKAAHPNRAYSYGEDDPNRVEEGTRRGAGKQIVGNRGLTRYRPKESHNPRAAKRIKYNKKVKQLGSVVQKYKGQTNDYSGESSGIKTNFIKSTKL